MAKTDVVNFEVGTVSQQPSRNPTAYFQHYDQQTSRYNEDYVNPSSWTVRATAYNGLLDYIRDEEPDFQALQIDPGADILLGGEVLDIIGPADPVFVPAEIESYNWVIFQLDQTVDPFRDEVVKSLGDARSITSAEFEVPALGRYEVTLTVRFEDGSTETSPQRIVTLHDFLVVCIGDSFASGEGVPDVRGTPTAISDIPGIPLITDIPGSPISLSDALCFGPLLVDMIADTPAWLDFLLGLPGWSMDEEAVWQEPNAHRSVVTSYSGQAARIAESNRGSQGDMITYLSFARSGSKIVDGLLNRKDGSIDVGQIDEIRRTIGDRTIDALIISIGVNDVGFEQVMQDINFNTDLLIPSVKTVFALAAALGASEVAGRNLVVDEVREKIRELPDRYRSLQESLETLDPPPRNVYLVEYPEGMFEKTDAGGNDFIDGGCGVFDILPHLNLNMEDAIALRVLAGELNQAMREAAEAQNWTYIGGISEAFRGRGYCAGEADTFFVTAEESCRIQGDFMGMVHPNYAGHLAVGEILADRLERDLFGTGGPIRGQVSPGGQQGPADPSGPTA